MRMYADEEEEKSRRRRRPKNANHFTRNDLEEFGSKLAKLRTSATAGRPVHSRLGAFETGAADAMPAALTTRKRNSSADLRQRLAATSTGKAQQLSSMVLKVGGRQLTGRIRKHVDDDVDDQSYSDEDEIEDDDDDNHIKSTLSLETDLRSKLKSRLGAK